MYFPSQKLFFLTLVYLLFLSALSQTYTTPQTNFVISNFPYSNGGLNTPFPIGPTNTAITGLTVSSVNIGLVPAVTTTLLLANGLLMNDLSLLPLGGFSYSYSISGLPPWATYYSQTKSIVANAPLGFSNTQFNLTYSDNRNNVNTITVIFSQSSGYSTSSLNFVVNNTINSVANTYTLVFPLFTTTSSSISSIRANGVGALTNIGVRPWTNVIPVTWSSSYNNNTNTTNNITNLITNSSGTYLNGTLISNSGFFTNSTGTYYNGIYVGIGFTTNSTGTYYEGIYVGEPGYVVTSTGVYRAGVLISTITTPNIPVSATISGTGVSVNSIDTSFGSATAMNTAYTANTVAPFVVNSQGGSSTTTFNGANGVVGTASGNVLTPGTIVNPQASATSNQYRYDTMGNIIGYANGSSITTNTNSQYLYSTSGTNVINPSSAALTIPGGTIVLPAGQIVSNTGGGSVVNNAGALTNSYNTATTTTTTTTNGGTVIVPGGTITQMG